MTTQPIEIIPANINLAPESRQSIENSFSEFFIEARQWQGKTAEITTPKEAREARLKLVKLRTSADKKRKELKEDYLRMGKAIDGANNILLALVVPLENQMEEIEKAEERRIAAERESLIAERTELLRPFISPETPLPALADMTQDQFDSMLNDAKFLHAAKLEAAAKLESDRIERERKEAEEREAQRLENIRLKAEAESREAAMKAEREAAEKARKEAEEKARKEREAIERKAAEERAKVEAQAKVEREAREAAERESARLKAESERKEREEKAAADAKAKAEAEAARKAAAAPDKQKLMTFAQSVRSLQVPESKSEDGKRVASEIAEKVESFAKWIESQASKL